MSMETVRVFAVAKMSWIRQQQRKLREQERETPAEFIDRESHYVWGRRYLLKVIEVEGAPSIALNHGRLILRVRPGADAEKRASVVEEWQRNQLHAALPEIIERWQKVLGVSVQAFHLQRMKTKWGSCNASRRSIRINTDLVRKPCECLEYIVVHEMVHLLERRHNANFMALMNRFMPKWQAHRRLLNSLPIRHEHWDY
jgi:predicted metal-dependent hydrolase